MAMLQCMREVYIFHSFSVLAMISNVVFQNGSHPSRKSPLKSGESYISKVFHKSSIVLNLSLLTTLTDLAALPGVKDLTNSTAYSISTKDGDSTVYASSYPVKKLDGSLQLCDVSGSIVIIL